MRKLLLTLTFALLASVASAQTTIVNPSALRFESPAQSNTNPLDDPDSYIVEFYEEGASEPNTTRTAPASAVVAVSGTTPQQYDLPFVALPSYPVGVRYTAKVRASNTAGQSSASAATADFFGQRVPPAAPVSPAVRP